MGFNNPTIADFKNFFVRDFPYNTDPALGVTDADIAEAMNEADISINQALWSNQNQYKTAFLLLTAHFLVMDIRASSQGLSGQYNWITTSKAVGNVSQGFSVPQKIMDNPYMAMLTQTMYGAKYLMLCLPKLVGPMFVVAGETLA